jgi:hypothetical protein
VSSMRPWRDLWWGRRKQWLRSFSWTNHCIVFYV